jgi:uncharacterized protein YbcI
MAAQISREIVKLHAELFGRGPTKAKTYVQRDYVLCILEDVFTPAERTLVKAGHKDQVYATRAAFQEALKTTFVGTVEEATGVKVRAFISQISTDPEVSAELFLLETAHDAPHEVDSELAGDT